MTLLVKCVARKMTTKDNREFFAYETTLKDGTLRRLKFRKEVSAPEKSCYLRVSAENLNDGKDKKGYPCVWVSKIDEILPFEDGSSRVKRLSEIFDEA